MRSCAPALLRSCSKVVLCTALILGPGAVWATDADGDGIEAAWEATYGLSDNNAADASLDPDGDFLTNLGEYLAKTSPTDPDTYNDGVPDVYNYGLEGYWRFSEATGTPASTANKVAGAPALTLNGASITGSGLFDNALRSTYYSQNVTAAAALFSSVMEWSFSGWFKMDSVQGTNVIFAAKATSSSTNAIGAHLSATSWGNMTLYVTLAGSTYSSTVYVASGSSYHHLAVSRNQTTNKAEVYFDGALVTAHPVTASPEPLTLASGQFKVSSVPYPGYPGYSYWFYGSIDDVRLYKRRLVATEIEALYNNGLTSSGAAKYWTLSYLLNNSAQGQADADSDGYTNLAEVIAGSDPQSNTSKPVPAATGYQLHTKLG